MSRPSIRYYISYRGNSVFQKRSILDNVLFLCYLDTDLLNVYIFIKRFLINTNMEVQRYLNLIHFAVKNIYNKNILESVSQFTYIDINISFTRGYIDVSKKTRLSETIFIFLNGYTRYVLKKQKEILNNSKLKNKNLDGIYYPSPLFLNKY